MRVNVGFEMAQQQDLGSSKLFPIFQKKYRPQRPGPLHEIQRTLEKSELVQKEGAKKRRCLLGNKETPGKKNFGLLCKFL